MVSRLVASPSDDRTASEAIPIIMPSIIRLVRNRYRRRLRRDCEAKARGAAKQRVESDLAFQAGQWSAKAIMDAKAECEVLVVFSGEVERVRIAELSIIAIGRSKDGKNQGTLRDCRSGDHHVLASEAFGELCFARFDGDDPMQPCVTRFPHLAHATRPDGRKNFVGSQAGSDS